MQLGSWADGFSVVPGRRSLRSIVSRLGEAHLVLLLGASWALVGPACSRTQRAGDVSVTWTAEPTPLITGAPIVAELILRDDRRQPLRGANLHIEGHMSHPGMAPILAVAEERGDGVYLVRFQFTMAGDWVVLVKGSLPDGRMVSHRVDIADVRPSG